MKKENKKENKKQSRKNFLKVLGIGLVSIPLLFKFISADMFLRKEDGSTINFNDIHSKTNVKGHVAHGATAATARASGFTSVEWVGSVEPTNASNGDTWIDTA